MTLLLSLLISAFPATDLNQYGVKQISAAAWINLGQFYKFPLMSVNSTSYRGPDRLEDWCESWSQGHRLTNQRPALICTPGTFAVQSRFPAFTFLFSMTTLFLTSTPSHTQCRTCRTCFSPLQLPLWEPKTQVRPTVQLNALIWILILTHTHQYTHTPCCVWPLLHGCKPPVSVGKPCAILISVPLH